MASLIKLFRQRAVESGDSVALIHGRTQISYGDLDRMSDLAAHQLTESGVRPGTLVGLLVERDLETVVSLLAILKAGAAYVPVDPEYPRDRLSFIIDDSDVAFLVGARESVRSSGLLDHRFVDRPELAHLSVTGAVPELPRVAGEDVAYVIYTSGSTGKPKGCSITHGNVVALLEGSLPLFDFRAEDRWTVFHSFCFDFSVWELWGALSTGASVVIAPWEAVVSPAELVDFLAEHRVTVLNQVPSVFRYTAQEFERAGFPKTSLRYVVFGGESVNLDVVRDFVKGVGDGAPVMVNMYGITENTVHSTFKRLDGAVLEGGSSSPIGRPLPHVGVHVLDEDRNPMADGENGELWLSGPSVSSGYLGREELTKQRFVSLNVGPDRGTTLCYRTGDVVRRLPDGELEYVGRNDEQIKIRGFRIELREIEHALESHPSVVEAAVSVVDTRTGPMLVSCLVSTEELDRGSTAQVRGHLSSLLPAHMVPRFYESVEKMPLTPSGKRDRQAVARLFSSRLGAQGG